MKKAITVCLALLWLILTPTAVWAAEDYTISATSATAKPGETVLLPLTLSGNKGIMGFRLTIRYPDEQLTLTEVSPGSVTASGLFNTTITAYESVKGEFDILWSNSEAVTTDGTVAMLGFRIQPTAVNGDYSISITYSQEDTFDGNYADVALLCQPVPVTVNDGTVTEPAADAATTVPDADSDSDKVADSYLITSVEEIIKSFNSDINALTEEQQNLVVAYVNNRVDSYGGGKKYADFHTLKSDYIEAVKNEAARKVLESTDDSAIQQAAEEIMTSYGVAAFGDLPAEQQQEAVEKMLQRLADSGADETGFTNIDDAQTAAQVLDDIVRESQKRQNEGIDTTKAATGTEGKGKGIAVCIACLALAMLIILMVILFKKRRNNDEKAE